MLIGGFISSGIIAFLLTLDGLVYNLIRYIYDIFIFLAKLNLFDESDYMEIVGKIYIILGVVMLFILAYSLLKSVINPDDFAKGDLSFPNLIKNIIISIIIIAVLPTVFSVAFNIQAAVLNSDAIPQIILGDTGVSDEAVRLNGGNTIAFNVFRAFFQPNAEYCQDELGITLDECSNRIEKNGGFFGWITRQQTLSEADDYVRNYNASFTTYSGFSDAADDQKITYTYIISTVVGVLVGAILLSYCIDLAVRVIKLIFFQIVAPIPVICRVLPGDKKKIFDNWLKQVTSTFLEVFIRVAIMYLGIYLITKVVEKFSFENINNIPGIGNLGFTQRLFALVFLIVGIIMFVRSAPKLIKDLFGIDLGGSTFGRLLGMGAAIGGGSLGFVRNFSKGINSDKGFWRSAGSALAGGSSAAVRSAYNARNAKSLSDMANAASKGLSGAAEARVNRAKYKATHGGNIRGVIAGHANDALDFFTGNGVEELDAQIKAASDIDAANTKFRDAVKKQWDKHSTDSSLLADMSTVDANGNVVNQFKGVGNDQMLEFYNAYRAQGLSASAIKQDIEAQRSAHQKKDYDALAREKIGEFGDDQINAIDINQFAVRDASGKIVDYDDAAYQQEIARQRDIHEKRIAQEASRLRTEGATKIAQLDSMYSQMEKYNITQLGEAALAGRAVGSISESDWFDARQLGESAQEVIKSSGLVTREGGKIYINDPAKKTRVELGAGGMTKSIDDFASAAGNISSNASLKKQAYLEKKGSSK